MKRIISANLEPDFVPHICQICEQENAENPRKASMQIAGLWVCPYHAQLSVTEIQEYRDAIEQSPRGSFVSDPHSRWKKDFT